MMMKDHESMVHIPIWGIEAARGRLLVIGTVTADRTSSNTVYTAQADDDTEQFPTEVLAADWLERRDRRTFVYVLIGRVFRPEAKLPADEQLVAAAG